MPPFRPGDLVEVRPAHEILATLDHAGSLEMMPFMPEMLDHIGQRFVVSKRVEKICDTICQTGSRRMRNTVMLEALRCSGSGHGGCQAECRIYWKEAWLTTPSPSATGRGVSDRRGFNELRKLVEARTRWEFPTGGEPGEHYRCQATEAFRASDPMGRFAVGQFVRELAAGNVGVFRFIKVMARAFTWGISRRLGKPLEPTIVPSQWRETPAPLRLQEGEWVEVRSEEEIARTLNAKRFNRGMVFSAAEMLPACGKRFQVRRRVTRLIDDRNGRMLNLKNDCIVLEGFVCTGELSGGRWFCPRELFPYWREAWLKRPEETSRS